MERQHGLITTPFPLDHGYTATLSLPAAGLTTRDAERLHEAIDALVTDPGPPDNEGSE